VFLYIILDLGIMQRNAKIMSYKQALIQTIIWVMLSLCFSILVWRFYEGDLDNKTAALQFISCYLMEYSLSIDNIFVFIIIINFFNKIPVLD